MTTLVDLSASERLEMRRRLRAHLDRRAAVERPLVEARKTAAMSLARVTAARLKEEFGASRVAIFGSLATGQFGIFSDVDLAVWGVGEDRRAAAFCALAGDRERPGSLGPDIVFAETASPALLRSVQDAYLDI